MQLQLIPVDDELALVSPDDLLQRLNLKEGDTVYLEETEQGVCLTADPPDAGSTN